MKKKIIVTEGQLKLILREMAFQGKSIGNNMTQLQKFQNLGRLVMTVFIPNGIPFWNNSYIGNYFKELGALIKQAKDEDRNTSWRNKNINPLIKEIIYDKDCFANKGAQNFALKRMGWPVMGGNAETEIYDNAVFNFDEQYKTNREIGNSISQQEQDDNKVGAQLKMENKLRELLEAVPNYGYNGLNFFRTWMGDKFPEEVELHEREGVTNIRLIEYIKECPNEELKAKFNSYMKVWLKCQKNYFLYNGDSIITFRRASAKKGKKEDIETISPYIDRLESGIGRNTINRESLAIINTLNGEPYLSLSVNNNRIGGILI